MSRLPAPSTETLFRVALLAAMEERLRSPGVLAGWRHRRLTVAVFAVKFYQTSFDVGKGAIDSAVEVTANKILAPLIDYLRLSQDEPGELHAEDIDELLLLACSRAEVYL